MISIVLISITTYLAAGTLLALALGRFMRNTSDREDETLYRRTFTPSQPARRKTA